MTTSEIETVISLNKCRFYDFYYETRDEYIIRHPDCDEPDTYSKPSAHSCMLVKRVFDNYLLTPEVSDYLKLVEVLRFCNDLLITGDIFELINGTSMNIIFTQIYNYGIILSELENGGITIKNILSHISTQKLKPGLLELLIYIVYKNLTELTGVTSRTNSHDIRSLSVSSDISANGIMKGDMKGDIRSDVMLSASLGDSLLKYNTVSGINIYNYIIQWVFNKFKARMFWITPDLYSGSLKLLRFSTILTEDTCSLISQTLKRFIKPELLISKVSQPNTWYIEYELTESLNILKNKIITKDQQWIKQLLTQYRQTLPVIPETGKKVSLVLIDGANWFYNPKAIGGKSNLQRDEIDGIGTPVWNDSIIGRIRFHMRDKLGYDPSEHFIKNLRIIIVFNERHKPFIHQICEDLDQFIIYTPRGMNDDAMLLYLWLSNPGSLLLSNDQYNDWSNHIAGNHYLMGLWSQWSAYMKISK